MLTMAQMAMIRLAVEGAEALVQMIQRLLANLETMTDEELEAAIEKEQARKDALMERLRLGNEREEPD